MRFWTVKRRRWAYSVVAAALALALVYGFITAEQLGAWSVLAQAVLAVAAGTNVMAARNTRDPAPLEQPPARDRPGRP